MFSVKNREYAEKLNELVLLQSQVKALSLQDQLVKQNSLEKMKNVFETVTDTVKATAQETIGGVKVATKSIELKTEQTNE